MKKVLLALVMLSGCASGPPLKVPDGSHRLPVNTVVLPEAGVDGGTDEARHPQDRMEWR